MAEFIGGLSLGLVFLLIYIWWHTTTVHMWYEPREVDVDEYMADKEIVD